MLNFQFKISLDFIVNTDCHIMVMESVVNLSLVYSLF